MNVPVVLLMVAPAGTLAPREYTTVAFPPAASGAYATNCTEKHCPSVAGRIGDVGSKKTGA